MSSLINVSGIDWATKPKNRALVQLQYDSSTARARVTKIEQQLPHDMIAQIVNDPAIQVVGVDIPFGWPASFVEFVGHWSATYRPQASRPGMAKHFSYRTTDLFVQETLGKWPLSVSSERIALGAFAWAQYVQEHRLHQRIDCGSGRIGEGPTIIEVYPAATLAALSHSVTLKIKGYKKDASIRRTLLDALFNEFKVDCADEERLKLVSQGTDSDKTDAFIAALTALIYAGVPGRSIHNPTPEQKDSAQHEGWIFFPT